MCCTEEEQVYELQEHSLAGYLPFNLADCVVANSYRSFRESDLFPYIQDTWKVSQTLTLNLKLRYDFISNPIEAHNQLCAFIDPSNPSTTGCTPVSHVFPSNPSVKRLDPRVGFAWDPFKDHKTSIRAGVDVFHDPIQVRNYHPAYIFAGPFQTAVSLCVFGGRPAEVATHNRDALRVR